jgi:hypothetical protein
MKEGEHCSRGHNAPLVKPLAGASPGSELRDLRRRQSLRVCRQWITSSILRLNMGTPTTVPNGLSYPSRQRDVPQLRILPVAAMLPELALVLRRSDR